MKLNRGQRDFVYDWIDFIINNADITEKFEYDIIDEYDESIETMEIPVNYKIDSEEHKVFIISINEKGLDQHKKERQF